MVGIGVIGVGSWGQHYVPIVAQHPRARLTWVCDLARDRAEQLAARHQARYTDDLDDVLQAQDTDAVIIATPESLHYEQALKALRSGKHVLVEKPVSLAVDEIRDLHQRAQRAGRIVLPGHVLRFAPSYAHALRELRSGRLGRVYAIYARRNVPRERLSLHNRLHPVFMALIHDIDLVLACVASEPDRVVALEARTDPSLLNPDLFWGVVHFADGCLAAFESLWTLPTSARYVDAALEIYAEGGRLSVRYPGDVLCEETREELSWPDTQLLVQVGDRLAGALVAQVDYFVRCIEDGRQPSVVTLADALRAVSLARALVDAARG